VPCLLTGAEHPSGTDRVREAAAHLGLASDAVIANIQGDEPLLEPEMLDALLAPFRGGDVKAATLAAPLDPVRDAALVASPHQVKVVVNLRGDALYFSRSPIPFARDGIPRYLGHIGLYAFRRDVLDAVTSLPPSFLEKTEKLEQLRFLEHNIPMRVSLTSCHPRGVDTPDDLSAVRALFAARSVSGLDVSFQ
jgi:3-deoxy-manno-octulosonate cytidylyltransferase (CMP-KDO synthetase)